MPRYTRGFLDQKHGDCNEISEMPLTKSFSLEQLHNDIPGGDGILE